MPANIDKIIRRNQTPGFLAVAFRRFVEFDGIHVSIVYRMSNGRLQMLHLADHRVLEGDPHKNKEPDLSKYLCIAPVGETEAKAIAGQVRRIHTLHYGKGAIPFSIRWDEKIGFSETSRELFK